LTRKLILASAGAGKTRYIAKQALEMAENGQAALILTYTENNPKELTNKICKVNGYVPSNITIKGWFTFLLEDMIRPYQRCVFKDRIPGIHLNSFNPHIRCGRTLKGRSEKLNGAYNPLCFLTKSDKKAHTIYLSKLASIIHKETKGKTTQRLAEIYNAVFIDEVQDLIGWDFDIIRAVAKVKECMFICVGSFRQTIYTTSNAQKKPKTNAEKLKSFKKIGFEPEYMNISWRCIQPICNFADLVHSDENCYPTTSSQVIEVPDEHAEHLGVFVISSDTVSEYIQRYNPVILRLNKTTQMQLCAQHSAYNFGESKGLGFERILILPTKKHRNFLSERAQSLIVVKQKKQKTLFMLLLHEQGTASHLSMMVTSLLMASMYGHRADGSG
jgi:DNA helicase-2/ATP-dependent DNA helicase PcrA